MCGGGGGGGGGGLPNSKMKPWFLFHYYPFLYVCVWIGASVEVYSDEEKNFKGLFFQDVQMADAFQAYPEIIFLDATYKLLELGLPVYIMLCEDSNGQSEIIAVCLLVFEDVIWMMNTFKKMNSKWGNIKNNLRYNTCSMSRQ